MPPFGFHPEFSQPGSSVPSRQGSFSFNPNGPQPSGLSAYPPPPPPATGSQLGSSPPGDLAPIYGGPQLGQQHQIILGRAVRGQEYIAPGPAGPGYGNGFAPDVRQMRSPLLDEFRSNRNRTWELPVRLSLPHLTSLGCYSSKLFLSRRIGYRWTCRRIRW